MFAGSERRQPAAKSFEQEAFEAAGGGLSEKGVGDAS